MKDAAGIEVFNDSEVEDDEAPIVPHAALPISTGDVGSSKEHALFAGDLDYASADIGREADAIALREQQELNALVGMMEGDAVYSSHHHGQQQQQQQQHFGSDDDEVDQLLMEYISTEQIDGVHHDEEEMDLSIG